MIILQGVLLGLAIAAPVGPIGLLCIRRTLNNGRMIGLATGLGAATADGMYALIAALGISAIISTLLSYQTIFQVAGGSFICYLGFRSIFAKPANSEADTPPKISSLGSSYFSSFLLTISNPLTIASFLGIFAGLSVTTAAHHSLVLTILLVAGVFAGSALWWFFLSSIVGIFHQRLNTTIMRIINIGSGLILVGFGIILLASLV